MECFSIAVWDGTIQEGSGILMSESKALNKTALSFASTLKEEIATNPEELLAAAHASCYCMMLSSLLTQSGFSDINLKVMATVHLDSQQGAITESCINVKAFIPNIEQALFDQLVAKAQADCPIGRSLKANLSVQAQLLEIPYTHDEYL
ncbi:OsmC family peroxiredoxin [Neisseria sp. Ec49-e6-T10]|uniref:OsmC family peroxiredoxin n=1 Tax=Neisseria sp. Ec49-e6-T10 TaxID=3140744 RepID=UPI003EB84513